MLLAGVLLVGCTSTLYQAHSSRLTLASGNQVESYEEWPSMFGAICGAIVSDKSGKIVQVIPGNCSTPLMLVMGSPVNYGLASLMVTPP